MSIILYRLVFRDHKSPCTQLPFLIEHKSPRIYTASILPEIYLSIVSSLVQKCASAHDKVNLGRA